MFNDRTIEYQDLGLIPYIEAWKLQDELREKRIAGEIGDRILLLEHPKVFTLGKKDCAEDFLSDKDAIRKEGIDIVKTNRGGRITYHGPGQLVCYFIIANDSLGLGVKEFVHAIEEICIGVLESFGIESGRDTDHPGIWIGNEKIAAVGLHFSHGVSQHGFALNVDCDLSPYRHIIACGIRDRGVTSLARHAKAAISMSAVKTSVIENAGKVFKSWMLPIK